MKKVVRLYYGFQFFFPLLLWLPVFYEYQKRMGLSDPQIFSIQSLYYIAFCLLEIPTGFVADFWGCRRSMRLGAGVLVVSNLIPVFFTGYSGFLAHFILVAVSRSLISGAANAYIYDYLKSRGAAEDYKRVEGNARAYGLAGKVVCWAGIGAVMQWHLTLPYWLTAFCALASFIIAGKLPELTGVPALRGAAPAPNGGGRVWTGFRDYFGPVLRILGNSPFLVILMFQGTGVFALAHICQVNLYQPVLGAKSFSVVSFGWIMSVMTVFEAVGSAYHSWTRRFLSDLMAVFALTVVIALSFSLMAVSGKAGTMAGLFIFAYATGLSYPLQRQLLNDAIPDSRYRATLLSIESIIDRAICACVTPFIAGFVSGGQMGFLLHILAMGTAVFMGILFFLVSNTGRAHCLQPEFRS